MAGLKDAHEDEKCLMSLDEMERNFMYKLQKEKIIFFVFGLALLFSLSGCGTGTPASHQNQNAAQENSGITEGGAFQTTEEADTEEQTSEETKEETENKIFSSGDTMDYDQYIDNTPNTAEPRDYTEEEIEVDITEKLYVSYINDIYVNAESYIGKMIRIEGMYLGETYEGQNYYYVYRKGPGCCSNDGDMAGFEFTYNGDMPKNGDWIEVVGTLRQYMEGQLAYLTLDAVSVTVKDERGAEEVTN